MPDRSSAPTVFLSYRRQDTGHLAGRLYDRLRDRFGDDRAFIDAGFLVPGQDFHDAITAAIARSDVLLVLIGPRWVAAEDDSGRRRLDDPDDVVVLEIATALERGIPVIPVLVDGTRMPGTEHLPLRIAALGRRHAVPVDQQTFESDVAALLGHVGGASTGSTGRRWTRRRAVRVAAAVLVGSGVLGSARLAGGLAGTSAGCADFGTDFASGVDPRLSRTNDVGGTQTFEAGDHRLVVRAPLGADVRVDQQGQVTAPYVSLPVSGDFTVETTVSADPTRSYQGAGLLLLSDPDNYVRLERGRGDFDAIAFEFGREGNHFKLNGPFEGETHPVRTDADPVDLRLSRTGSQVRASWRAAGGATWQDLPVTAPLAGDASAGVAALNVALAPPVGLAAEAPFAAAFTRLAVRCA